MVLATEKLHSINLEKQIWNWRGYKIQYVVMGKGKPLILVHGFGFSMGHWHKNIPVLADAGYKVYAVDLLGFGDSDKPLLDYSMNIWVELLRDFWVAHLQKPAVFIGNSLGAFISLTMLTQYPGMSAGGVLINPTGGLGHSYHQLNLLLRTVVTTFSLVLRSPITGKFIFNRIRQKAQIRRTLYQLYRDRSAVTNELVDLLYTPYSYSGAQEAFVSVLTASVGLSPVELLPKLKRPLLVIWGANDPWQAPAIGSKIYKEACAKGKDIKIVPIPGAGHCPHDEVPQIVNPKIIDWLTLYLPGEYLLF